jgi:hypothetical protein
MPKNIIRKLAERGQLGRAIDALLELSEKLDDKYARRDASGLSGRFYGLENQKNMGAITSEYYLIQSNGIRHALYSILNDLPTMADDAYDLPSLRGINFDNGDRPPEPEPPGEEEAETDNTNDRLRVLMFTANTAGEVQLDQSDEFSRVREMLDNEGLNDRCKLRRVRLVTPEAILESILDFRPHVVHFSGHGVRQRTTGAATGPRRGFGEEEEAETVADEGIETGSDGALIVHNSANYGSFQIGSDFLGGVFEYVKDEQLPTHTVLFNACHSEAISGGVAPFVDNIIATNNEIGDRAAISFSSTFYDRLIASEVSPERAFKAARIVAIAYGEPKSRFVFYHAGKKRTSSG